VPCAVLLAVAAASGAAAAEPTCTTSPDATQALMGRYICKCCGLQTPHNTTARGAAPRHQQEPASSLPHAPMPSAGCPLLLLPPPPPRLCSADELRNNRQKICGPPDFVEDPGKAGFKVLELCTLVSRCRRCHALHAGTATAAATAAAEAAGRSIAVARLVGLGAQLAPVAWLFTITGVWMV
jgi:hypothetical protein